MRGSRNGSFVAVALLVWAAGATAQAPSGKPDHKPRGPGAAGPPGASGRGHPPREPHAIPSGPWSVKRPPFPPGAGPRGLDEVGEGFRRGTIRKEELQSRLAELESNRRERRAARLAEMKTRYPAATLSNPAVRAELRAHARRMALLHRAQIVAQAELEDPKRQKALTRIDGLLEKERARHERRMTKLSAAGPAGSASASASVPAPSARPAGSVQ